MRIKDPLLVPAICFAAGVLVSPALAITAPHLGIAIITSILAAAFSGFRRWYILIVSLFFGMAAERASAPGLARELDSETGEVVLIGGCIIEPPVFSEGREQFVLELEPRARARVSMFLRAGDTPPDLHYGQRVDLEARIRKPHNFGNPGAFDYVGYLAFQNIYWTATMPSGSRPKILPGRCGSAWMAWIYGLRGSLLERIARLYEGQPYAIGTLQALLVGESSRFERVWADYFRRTGTYHAIVVSGMHVAVIAAAILALLRLLPFDPNAGRIVAVLLVWIYAGVCGWQAPVVRAAGGFTLYAIGRFYYRQCRVLNLLAALAIVFLVFDPQQLAQASFQLTFLSVLALGALAAPAVEATTGPLRYGLRDLGDVAKDLHIPPRIAQFRVELRLMAETFVLWLRLPFAAANWVVRIPAYVVFWAWETMLISAAIQLGLALPMIFYFHRLSISGLSANLFVTPLLTFAVPTGLIAMLTEWRWLVALTGWMVEGSRRIAVWHAGWEPGWRVPDPPVWLALAFLITLLALAVFRKRLLLIPVLLLLAVIAWHPFPAQRAAGQLEVTMIDVGQGDSILVAFPDGRLMLIDGGGVPTFGNRPKPRMDIGEDVVASYLLTRSIRHVDIMVSTHQHDDHAGGLAALIDNFRPQELWAGASPDGQVWTALREHAARAGATVRNLRRGASMSYEGVRIDILAPPASYSPRAIPSNDDSLVMRLAFGDHSFLLTGDAERAVEYGMLAALTRTQVLKVSHHGSKTSTTPVFLDAVQPMFALISAGKDNMFRHPHPDIVERLKDRHATIFRTDQWGLVTILSDGKHFTVNTHRWTSQGFALQQAF